nr:unnamed protein product [Spirometra erinaceieuropaei]
MCFRVRAVWDAFISLTERKQIEILGSLPYQRAGCFLGSEEEEEEETADGSRPRRVDKNINNAAVSDSRRTRRPRCRPRRQHRGKPHVRLEDSLPDVEPLDSADVLDLLDASTVDPTALAGFHEGQEEQHQSMDCDVPSQGPAEGDYNSDTEVCRPPSVGSISPKLMAFIKTSARLMAADAGRGSKKRHFSVQDLCLIQRVEDELRTTFATAPATGSQTAAGDRRWTPSTSLLLPLKEAATAADDVNRIGAGRPLVLNGFHRMLVHATAAYLGLVSYSAWNASFEDRQLWVDNRYATFVPVDLNFVSAIRQALLEQQSQLCRRH